jgi:hypothetical protein
MIGISVKPLFFVLICTFMISGCSQSQPTQQELSMFDELDAINSKMNDLLFRDLDNYSAEEHEKIIYKEYTLLYKN